MSSEHVHKQCNFISLKTNNKEEKCRKRKTMKSCKQLPWDNELVGFCFLLATFYTAVCELY